jgi:Secretion system C-terminal sorting domain/GEVED domain
MKKTIYSICTMLFIVLAINGFGQCTPTIPVQPTQNQGLCNSVFGSIASNGIGCSTGYALIPLSQTLCVTPGTAYTLTARANTQFGGTAAMWFDANQDGLYSAAEIVFNGNASTFYNFSLPSNISAGQYNLRVVTNLSNGISSSNSCGSFFDGEDYTFTIAHTPVNNLTLSTTTISPCSGVTSTIAVVNTGTASVSGYNWTSYTTGFSSNTVGTTTLSSVSINNTWGSSSYTTGVVVTYTNGCTNTTSLTYSVNPEASSYVIAASGNASLCANTVNTLAYNTNFLYGTMVSHSWSTGSTANTATVLAGTSPVSASVTVTRNDGCVFTFTGTIGTSTTTPPVPTLNLSPSATVCANATINASFAGTTPYLVNWGNGNYVSSYSSGFPVAYAYHPTFSDTVINIIYRRGGFACSGQLTRTITVLASPTVAVSSGTICAGKSFTISPSGATTYGYSGGSAVVAPTASLTTYTVTGYTGSCSDTETLTVSVVANPTITVSGGAICSGNSFTINPTGATNYTYSSGSAIVSPATSTTYSVIGSNGTCSQTKTLTVTVNQVPVISGATSPTICSGNSYQIQSTGATSYTFASTTNTLYATTPNTVFTAFQTITPTTSITYTITGNVSGGCVSNPVVSNITVNTSPTIAVSSGTICRNQSFTISPSGATSYTYTGGSAVVSPTTTTTYVVTGANGNCSASKNVTVTVNPNPNAIVFLQPNAVFCPGAVTEMGYTNNSYSVTVNGVLSAEDGFGKYTYSATTTQTLNYVYTNTLTGCATVQSPIVYNVLSNTITISSSSANPICSGQSAILTASVAGTPANLAWSNAPVFGNTTTITPTITTTYTISGQDQAGYGCNYSATYTQSVTTCTGIEEATNNNLVSIYPNPVNDFMTVSLVAESLEVTTIYIINALGEIVLTEKVISSNKTLNTSNLTNGIYFIKVESKNGSAIKKFIKQ